MENLSTDGFPLSKQSKVKGSRRLAREKVLQVLCAYFICESSLDSLFQHVFFRKFNFGDNEEEKSTKLLKPEEIYELDADVPIIWKDDEIEFGRNLIHHTIENLEEIDKMIIKFAQNWELERIALIDHTLMQMATTELIKFPEIPPKVSINEALDIAKKYSTHKSRIFINGVLDSILNKLKKEGTINKTGRGLKEF